jgi:hypothetical protein
MKGTAGAAFEPTNGFDPEPITNQMQVPVVPHAWIVGPSVHHRLRHLVNRVQLLSLTRLVEPDSGEATHEKR